MKVICNRASCCNLCRGCWGNSPHEPDQVNGNEGEPAQPCTDFYRCPDAGCEVRCVQVDGRKE